MTSLADVLFTFSNVHHHVSSRGRDTASSDNPMVGRLCGRSSSKRHGDGRPGAWNSTKCERARFVVPEILLAVFG